jgi:hypothetical protein
MSDGAEALASKSACPSRGGVAFRLALNSMTVAQLNGLEAMVDDGRIDEKTYEALLPTVLPELHKINPSPEVGHADVGPARNDRMVACPNAKCGAKNNTQWERVCRECGSVLVHQQVGSDSASKAPKPPSNEPKPSREPLCQLPLYGGVFKAYLTGNESAVDSDGTPRCLHVVVCRWEKEGVRTEQWTVKYKISDYRSLRKVIKRLLPDAGRGDDDNDIEDGGGVQLPKLPERINIKAQDDTGSTVISLPAAERTRYLYEFLRYIFQIDLAMERTSKGDSALLATDEIDRFFGIREHTIDCETKLQLENDSALRAPTRNQVGSRRVPCLYHPCSIL